MEQKEIIKKCFEIRERSSFIRLFFVSGLYVILFPFSNILFSVYTNILPSNYQLPLNNNIFFIAFIISLIVVIFGIFCDIMRYKIYKENQKDIEVLK